MKIYECLLKRKSIKNKEVWGQDIKLIVSCLYYINKNGEKF